MEQLERIARGAPQSVLLKLEQCGHAPQRDQPERVMQAIGELFARVRDAA
jgi:pimeloyl-ACP methyl ester carboxylesterase